MKTKSEQWKELSDEQDAALGKLHSLVNTMTGYFAAIAQGGSRENPPMNLLTEVNEAREEVDEVKQRVDKFLAENI